MSTSDFQPVIQNDLSVTILDGEDTSNAVDLQGTSLLAFITDANLTGTSFTFLSSDALNGDYLPLKNMSDGAALTSVAGISAQYVTDPSDFASVRFLKFVSGAAQAGADTVIKLVNRRLA